jgi:hypothetical protein
MSNISKICPRCAGIELTVDNIENPQWWFCRSHRHVCAEVIADHLVSTGLVIKGVDGKYRVIEHSNGMGVQ